MVETICCNCGGTYQWNWEEAFDKFGFNDGDGQVETETVATALEDAGYEVTLNQYGLHNLVITSIKKGNTELIGKSVDLGYDDPCTYLPKEIIALLDHLLPPS